MHQYGDCSCCGGEVKAEKVELDYRYKGKLYVFENVPVGVCRQCGEKYLTANVAKEIERQILSQKQWKKIISVPVSIFPERLAA